VSCDSSCSGHGTCLTIENIYDFYTVGDDGNYDKWDAKQVTGCICEMGYTGANCDMRTCCLSTTLLLVVLMMLFIAV
jgi:hypothetical protein